MKSYFAFIFLLLFAYSGFAQAAFSHQNEIIPKISGHLTGYDSTLDSTLKMSFIFVVPSASRQRTFDIQPKEDGSFEIATPHALHSRYAKKCGQYR
ncbi:MAG: hypothetical protein AAF849_06430 [Bacteroidota bacterium]